jgi:5'-deoxynucleotidase YfbR-like HD superfamily hydrolase
MEEANNLIDHPTIPDEASNLDLPQILLGRITRLRYIKRYSICPRVHEESVAEHSYYTAFIALVVGMDLQTRGHSIQLGKLLARALMQDVDEAYSGDFIRMFKHSSPGLKTAIDAAALQFMRGFATEAGLGSMYLGFWTEAKDATLEGAIVSFADFASVVSYIAQELRSGNVVMREQLDELNKFCESFFVEKYQPLMVYVEAVHKIVLALKRGDYGLGQP